MLRAGAEPNDVARKLGVTPSTARAWRRALSATEDATDGNAGAPPTDATGIEVEAREVSASELPDLARAVPISPPATTPPSGPSAATVTAAEATLDVKPLAHFICQAYNRQLMKGPIEAGFAEPTLPEPISPDEEEQLAAAWGALMAKYAPLLREHAVEFNAIVVTAAVLGGRAWQSHEYWKWRQARDARMPKRAASDAERPAPSLGAPADAIAEPISGGEGPVTTAEAAALLSQIGGPA